MVGPVRVGRFDFLFGRVATGRALGSVAVPAWGHVYWWDGGGLVLWLLSGPPGFTGRISFARLFSFVCCWVLVFALSPFCVLVCVFGGMMRG